MAMTLAKITLIGNVGKVEPKYNPEGKFICEFSIAHNYGRGDNKETIWFGGAMWEKRGEMFNDMVQAGTLLYIEGNLEVQEWTDKEGKNHFKLVVKPSEFRVLAKGKAKAEASADEPDYMKD